MVFRPVPWRNIRGAFPMETTGILRRSAKPTLLFKHVIYIIKENRTYDQVLGDLSEGDGDPALVFFGRNVSPSHHALPLRFGLFDRFFTNAEVSSQGHIWSTAAYVTDFGEKPSHLR